MSTGLRRTLDRMPRSTTHAVQALNQTLRLTPLSDNGPQLGSLLLNFCSVFRSTDTFPRAQRQACLEATRLKNWSPQKSTRGTLAMCRTIESGQTIRTMSPLPLCLEVIWLSGTANKSRSIPCWGAVRSLRNLTGHIPKVMGTQWVCFPCLCPNRFVHSSRCAALLL
jgi:hypothetical protein